MIEDTILLVILIEIENIHRKYESPREKIYKS